MKLGVFAHLYAHHLDELAAKPERLEYRTDDLTDAWIKYSFSIQRHLYYNTEKIHAWVAVFYFSDNCFF